MESQKPMTVEDREQIYQNALLLVRLSRLAIPRLILEGSPGLFLRNARFLIARLLAVYLSVA